MKTISTLLFAAALCAAPSFAEDFVVNENLANTGTLVQSDRAAAGGWTSTRDVTGANIWVRVFNSTALQSRVTAYLVRGVGPGTTQSSAEVATMTFQLAANTSAWQQLFTNQTLPAGTYFVVLAANSAIAWQYASGGQPKLAPGFTIEPPRSASGVLTYPPAGNFQFNVNSPLGIVVTTDPDYFTTWASISTINYTFSGMNTSSPIVHTRPGLAGPFRWTTTGNLPTGLRVVGDEKTGALRIEGQTPANTAHAVTDFSIALTDQASGRTLNVSESMTNRSVTVNQGSGIFFFYYLRAGIAGSRYSEQIASPYGGTPPYRYSVSGELPTGLALNPDTGELSGTATTAGSYTYTVTVRDSANRTLTSGNITLAIDPATTVADNKNTGSPSAINTIVGANVDLQLGIGNGVTGFAPYLSNLPPGLALSATGRLTGRVTTPGIYGFCVQGRSSRRVVRCMNLHAFAPREARFNTLPAAALGAAYDQPLFASLTGGLIGAYFYQVLDDKGEPVPNNVVAPGITLNAQGRLTGTPTAAGTYPVRVRVRDYSSSWMNGTVSDFTAPSPLTVGVDSGAPAISGVTNGASFGTGGIAPGQIVTLFGANIGPAELTTLTLTGGRVSTTLAGTRVTVNNIAAPILYTSAGQVSIIVPYGVTSASASIVATYNNRTTAALVVPVVAASPALFTRNGSGKGLPAALNQDGSIHGEDKPAAPGSVLVLYGTGEGQSEPRPADGELATGSTLPTPMRPLTVTIGGKQAEVLYAGAAPGLVAGVFQINVKVPEDVEKGAMVPLVVQSGSDLKSPDGTYINVQ